MIDWTRVNELRSEIGVDDFEEVVELFLSEVEERLELLSVKIAAKEIEADLHFLKGSALNLGFSRLAEICRDGEKYTGSTGASFDKGPVYDVYKASKVVFLAKLAEGPTA